MAYSIEASSDSCYEGTTCLINKLGIRDEALLARTESAQGVMDGLINIFSELIEPKQELNMNQTF